MEKISDWREETVMIFRHEEPRSSRRVGERADGLAGSLTPFRNWQFRKCSSFLKCGFWPWKPGGGGRGRKFGKTAAGGGRDRERKREAKGKKKHPCGSSGCALRVPTSAPTLWAAFFCYRRSREREREEQTDLSRDHDLDDDDNSTNNNDPEFLLRWERWWCWQMLQWMKEWNAATAAAEGVEEEQEEQVGKMHSAHLLCSFFLFSPSSSSSPTTTTPASLFTRKAQVGL